VKTYIQNELDHAKQRVQEKQLDMNIVNVSNISFFFSGERFLDSRNVLINHSFLYRPQNMIAQSQSGTGKTAAFVIAMLSRVEPSEKYPQVLCLSPTLELALQIGQVVKKIGQFCTDIDIRYAVRGEEGNYFCYAVIPIYNGILNGLNVVIGKEPILLYIYCLYLHCLIVFVCLIIYSNCK